MLALCGIGEFMRRNTQHRSFITAVAVLSGLPMASGADDPRPIDAKALDAQLAEILNEHGDGLVASVWVGPASGLAWYTHKADTIRPTASTIKTAFLVTLFARFADSLDQPPPGLDAVLRDEHAAVAHFTPAQRAEIRKALAGISVRKLGGVMMASVPASNIVYNAAANVVTAVLGGPEGCTQAIRDRDPAFTRITVRRYMLAPRNITGDNEATAAALAAVLQRVACGKIPGATEATAEAIRHSVVPRDNHYGLKGRFSIKDGALDTDPLVRAQSGWWEPVSRGPPIVFVVMLTQPNPGKRSRSEAGERLQATCLRLTKTVLEAARPR
jgi:hypothetical protein